MSLHIPVDIAKAEKQGFSGPDQSWFKGESIEFVKRKLLTGNPRLYEYLDADSVRELIHQHLDGRENRRLLIWSLLNLDAWLEGNLWCPA
jgi:asparagine synthase (glutamine-hydrolysing)